MAGDVLHQQAEKLLAVAEVQALKATRDLLGEGDGPPFLVLGEPPLLGLTFPLRG